MNLSRHFSQLLGNRLVSGAMVLLPLIFVIYFFSQRKSDRDKSVPKAVDTVSQASDHTRRLPKQLEDGTYFDHESDFQKTYGSEQTNLQTDLKIVQAVLDRATILIKDFATLPLADNQHFTRLLTGNNKQKFAWIHPQHPAINAEGELMDRLGSPLVFHRISALVAEVRSAGEDRQMWTEDDVILSSTHPGSGIREGQ